MPDLGSRILVSHHREPPNPSPPAYGWAVIQGPRFLPLLAPASLGFPKSSLFSQRMSEGWLQVGPGLMVANSTSTTFPGQELRYLGKKAATCLGRKPGHGHVSMAGPVYLHRGSSSLWPVVGLGGVPFIALYLHLFKQESCSCHCDW